MEQLICHLFGDYVLQSDWAANNKTSKSLACLVHVILYGLPFLFLTFSPLALIVIVGTHFLIDRFRLAKYICYIKNLIFAPPDTWCEYKVLQNGVKVVGDILPKFTWENCKITGYPSEIPPFMAIWLMIITDNLMHLTINYCALKYL